MDERRRFERISIPEEANIYCEDRLGKRMGPVRVLGRGGLLLQTSEHFREGSIQQLTLVDETTEIRRPVRMIVRSAGTQGVGFEFEALAPDAAVEIGIVIGKYYAAQ